MKILNTTTLTQKLSVSRTTLWRMCNDSDLNFPSKVTIYGDKKGWIDEEVDHWLRERSTTNKDNN
ncbi:MAG: AlpA family phage regulatory protein [Candidatus Paceibacterota bacterium]